MKKITYFNIIDLINKNYNIDNFIKEIDIIMKNNYPDYEEWFLNKVIPNLYNNNRNIIIAYQNNQIIGFVNLKKKNNDKTISNLYIKPSIYYKKIWNSLVNESIKWLETDNPKFIISKTEISKCAELIISRNWELTNIKNCDMIFNGRGNEFERLLPKKKILLKK